MRILHIHFGKDGGAERFFVKLAGALARRGVAQAALIRSGRAWRRELPESLEVLEGVPRTLTLPWHVWRRNRLAKRFRPTGYLAWMPRAAQFLPFRASGPRVTRLGDYPEDLRAFSSTDLLVCNTPGIAEHVRRLGWTRRVEVISNFSPAPRVAPAARAELGIPAEAFLIVGVGRLVPRKGFASLVRAAAAMPGAHLLLVGSGGEEPALRELAKSLGAAGRIRLLGWSDQPAPFLAAADVVALPSLHEPLGNGILEAWALSKPVVAAASEGPSWVVADGVDGLLHPPDDAAALEACMARLRDDPGLRARLADAGRGTLDRRFSEEAVCRAYLDIYGSIG
jgi:glycosyltransferase involved in cell wall biosynthesis